MFYDVAELIQHSQKVLAGLSRDDLPESLTSEENKCFRGVVDTMERAYAAASASDILQPPQLQPISFRQSSGAPSASKKRRRGAR